MSEPVNFFDPRPPRGLWRPTADACRYPDPAPADGSYAELLDAELRACGQVMLQLRQGSDNDCARWSELDAVVNGPDGEIGLRLAGERLLVFAPPDRERVTAIVLKLANSHF